VVQRDVGFEFELDPDVQVFESGRFWIGYRSLGKRARVLNGQDFYVETDYLSGGSSSWEFVTTNFPESLPGMNRLIAVLDHIDGILQLMGGATVSQVNQPPAYNPVGNAFAAHGQPVPDRYFTFHSTPFRTKPQVTAGLDLVAVNQIFTSAANPAGPGVSDLARNVGSIDYFGRVNGPAQVDVGLGAMHQAAAQEIQNTYGNPPDPALQALVTQVLQIIIGGQQPIGVTPKTVLRLLLHRTDIKHTFDTLPNPLRGNIEAVPATFVNMVITAAQQINPAVQAGTPVISANLFTDPSNVGDPHHNMPSPFTQVTCGQWLTGIATPGGTDLMSAGNYPVRTWMWGMLNYREDVKANELLGSFGARHNLLDPGNRPVFELRSSKQIYASLIRPYALDFFKYVRYLHNPGALTETRLLTSLAANDLNDLIGFTPNRPVVAQNIDAQATGAFNN
jgi:hypothetical protein